MCEQFVARAAEPFRIDELWPFTERLERYGLAGFGWGAAWTRGDGRLCSHRDLRAFREDAEGAGSVGRRRRPPSSSTFGGRRGSRSCSPDAQPFDDPAGQNAFRLRRPARWRDARVRYQRAGRIHGRADTEVGARWLEDRWDGEQPATLLKALHDEFHGQANLAVLTADDAGALRRQHRQPRVHVSAWPYRLGEHGPVFARSLLVCDLRHQALYSSPGATRRRRAPRT